MRLNKRLIGSKGLVLMLALVLAVSMLSGCAKKKASGTDTTGGVTGDKSETVATYKGGKITKTEFDKFVSVNKFFDPQVAAAIGSPDMKYYVETQLLTQHAVMKILAPQATDASKKNAEDKATKYMDPIAKMTADQKTKFEAKLKELNITQVDLKTYLKETFTVMDTFDSKVTDQKVKETYDAKLKENPHTFDLATVRHILIAQKDVTDPTLQKDKRTDAEALKLAKEVRDKLVKGGNFDALAKQYSEDTASKDTGGKMENVHPATESWDPAFQKAVLDLPTNQLSEPVKSVYGYHIIRVDSRVVETLDKVKDQLRSQVAQTSFGDFIKNDLEKTYQFKSQLPQPSPAASQPPANSPAASTQASPSASPAASGK